MDVFYAYTYGSAAWLALQAVPLILTPRIIITMSSSEVREATGTVPLLKILRTIMKKGSVKTISPPSGFYPLETYFGRSLGITQLTLATLTVLLTGSIPLSTASSGAAADDPDDFKAPYAVPTLVVTLVYHFLTAFYSYAIYNSTFVTSYAAGAVGSAALAFVAVWCLLFGSEKGRISSRTGADKRTSGWPFKNEEASKRKGKKKL
ncbi:MAG: hypothetical protein M1820_010903 [Bogoriella megaspora]|nr:MAG: hypothetical protein M1820_010903 [Bogoriella megaspora]